MLFIKCVAIMMPFSISSLTHSLLNSFSSTAYITRSNRQTKEHHNTHTHTGCTLYPQYCQAQCMTFSIEEACAVSGRSAWRHSGGSVAHNGPVCVTAWCVYLHFIYMCVFMWVVQTPQCHEKEFVYTVFACLSAWETVLNKETQNSVPHTLHPLPITRGPQTPIYHPVFMSLGLANLFNHLLIPKVGQADLKSPLKPFSQIAAGVAAVVQETPTISHCSNQHFTSWNLLSLQQDP